MKKARKLTAVLLSLVMLLALVVPASAADTYSITIHNDKTGHTYEAYQIFAGTVSDDETDDETDGGPMLGDITWGSGVNGGALLTALQAANAEKYAACTTAANVAEALGTETATAADAAAFADIAAQHLTATVAGTADAPEGGNYVIEGLPAGYYLVKDSLQEDDNQTGQVLSDYIVQVLGNVTMDPKDSDIPTVLKKVYDEEFAVNDEEGTYGTGYNDVADWDIGDRVPFKLIASVPQNIESYDEYTFIFHDTLSAGLTLDRDSLHVYVTETTDANINEFDPQAATLYTVSEVAENGTFTVTIPNIKALDSHDHPANYIIVAYDAFLNENAEIGLDGNPNSVSLEFSNDPNGEGTGRTEEDTVIVFTYELDGTKVDGADVDTKLEGAQFVLLNGGGTRAARVDETGKLTGWVEPDDIKEGLTGTNDREKMNELTNEDFANAGLAITSAADGTFKIAGLDDGTYYLREIQAPNGYNLLEGDVQLVITATTANGQDWNSGIATDALKGLTITVDNGAAQNGDLDTGIVNVTVENNRGATLPETGGMGTTLFYIIGGLLVVGAGILLVVRIRMKAHNE